MLAETEAAEGFAFIELVFVCHGRTRTRAIARDGCACLKASGGMRVSKVLAMKAARGKMAGGTGRISAGGPVVVVHDLGGVEDVLDGVSGLATFFDDGGGGDAL